MVGVTKKGGQPDDKILFCPAADRCGPQKAGPARPRSGRGPRPVSIKDITNLLFLFFILNTSLSFWNYNLIIWNKYYYCS